jgi:hypothetical protein
LNENKFNNFIEINIAIPIKFQLKPNKNWLGITEINSSTNLRSNSFNQNPIDQIQLMTRMKGELIRNPLGKKLKEE